MINQVRGATAQTVQNAPSGLRRRDGEGQDRQEEGRAREWRNWSNGGGQGQLDALLLTLSHTQPDSLSLSLSPLCLSLNSVLPPLQNCQTTQRPSSGPQHTAQHSSYLSAEHSEQMVIQALLLQQKKNSRAAASCHVVQPSRILRRLQARETVMKLCSAVSSPFAMGRNEL